MLLAVLAAVAGAALSCSDREYLSNGQLLDRLEALAADHPQLASTYSIGLSARGVELKVLKLSGAPEDAGVPQVKLVGAIHGNEPPSSQVLLAFAEYLVTSYLEGEITAVWLLNNMRLHILPRLNPDGFSAAIEGECSLGPGRRNANNVDLNNVFPTSEDAEPQVLQPEVEAVIGWTAGERFTLSASFHTGSLVAVYPLDYPAGSKNSPKTPDDDVFRHLAKTYASSHRSMASGQSCKGAHFTDGIINGAEWYPKNGTMMDYNYLYAGTMELTFEINCCKYPPPRDLCLIWEANRMALLKLCSEAVGGIRGTVSSAGIPLERAVVTVLGRDMHVFTDFSGRFYRILLPGRYFIAVEMVGMERKVLEVVVPRRETSRPTYVELDVELVPELTDPMEPMDTGGLDPELSTSREEQTTQTSTTLSDIEEWPVNSDMDGDLDLDTLSPGTLEDVLLSTVSSEDGDLTLLTRKSIFGGSSRASSPAGLLLLLAVAAMLRT